MRAAHLVEVHLHLDERDFVFQEADRGPHRDRERARADQVRDLRVQVRRREVARERGLRWRSVGRDDLRGGGGGGGGGNFNSRELSGKSAGESKLLPERDGDAHP